MACKRRYSEGRLRTLKQLVKLCRLGVINQLLRLAEFAVGLLFARGYLNLLLIMVGTYLHCTTYKQLCSSYRQQK
jgi:hypothetical protein